MKPRYRYLKAGEIVQQWDVVRGSDSIWVVAKSTIGNTVSDQDEANKRFLRPITKKRPAPWSKQFKTARTAQGLTQEGGASALGCPVATLRDWEQGRRQPPLWAQSLVLHRLDSINRP